MNESIQLYNKALSGIEQNICNTLCNIISDGLPEAENKVWHGHPVWFIEGNPIVGYSKQKGGIRLMFWSGIDFDEEQLKASTGKFRDAGIFYTALGEISESDIHRWLKKSRNIQWDYKNIVRRKGVLERLK